MSVYRLSAFITSKTTPFRAVLAAHVYEYFHKIYLLTALLNGDCIRLLLHTSRTLRAIGWQILPR
jgi:hypothetical protein